MTSAYGATVKPRLRRRSDGGKGGLHKPSERLSLVTIAVSYAIFISACYLMAFWGSFGINVFQFVGLTDFAKLAIHPVALAVAGFAGISVVQAIGATFLGGDDEEPTQDDDEEFRKNSNRSLRATVLAMVVLPLIQAAGGPLSWFVASLLCIPFLLLLCRAKALRSYVPSRVTRRTLVLFAGLMPFWIVAVGKLDANAIKNGRTRVWVERVGAASTLMSSETSRLGYVGFVGGVYVIYEPLTRSIALVKQADGAPLILHEKSSQEIAEMKKQGFMEAVRELF